MLSCKHNLAQIMKDMSEELKRLWILKKINEPYEKEIHYLKCKILNS